MNHLSPQNILARQSFRMIRHLCWRLLCGFALSLPVFPVSAQTQTLLVLGDSLSAAYGIKIEEGWVSLLEKRLMVEQLSYQTVNASISGETTGGGLARLDGLLKQHSPSILVIALGANDGLRGQPVQLMKDNISHMIALGKGHHAQILLIGVQIPLNYGPRYTRLFNQSFIDLANDHHLPFLPSLLGDIPLNMQLMQTDRLHPNAEAQPLILDRVWPALKPLLKK